MEIITDHSSDFEHNEMIKDSKARSKQRRIKRNPFNDKTLRDKNLNSVVSTATGLLKSSKKKFQLSGNQSLGRSLSRPDSRNTIKTYIGSSNTQASIFKGHSDRHPGQDLSKTAKSYSKNRRIKRDIMSAHSKNRSQIDGGLSAFTPTLTLRKQLKILSKEQLSSELAIVFSLGNSKTWSTKIEAMEKIAEIFEVKKTSLSPGARDLK